jgi:4-carboxymuconolactone decarboxylase
MNQTGKPEPGTWNAERAADEFRRLRGVEPFGPFIDLLASPELMTRVSALGEYLRYRSALSPRLSELAILVTAAHWRQQFEWDIHAPIALEVGVPQAVIDAVWEHIPPPALDREQQALYEMCIALHRDRAVPPSLRERTQAVLGEHATIDAIAICGYYTLLAMVLNSQST